MTQKNQNIVKRAGKLSDATLSIIKGEEPVSDAAFIKELSENPYSTDYIDIISSEKELSSRVNRYNRPTEEIERELTRAKKSIKRAKERQRTMYISISSVAAAVIFLSFLLLNNPNSKDTIASSNSEHTSVIVDYSKPILVSENGEEKELDSSIVYIAKTPLTSIQNSTIIYDKIVVPSRNTFRVVLSDGTSVVLNANSSLRYPKTFANNKREVELTGEGYFEVAKSNIPFIVNGNGVDIKVYGTIFNVKHTRRGGVESVLIEGSIGVTVDGDDKEYMVKPMQLFSVSGDDVKLENVNPDSHIAWIDNSFSCDNELLTRFLDDIADWYGIKFNYDNLLDDKRRITVKISREMDIDNIIESMEGIFGLSIVRRRL